MPDYPRWFGFERGVAFWAHVEETCNSTRIAGGVDPGVMGREVSAPGGSVRADDGLNAILDEHLDRLAAGRHIHHAVAAVEKVDGSYRWTGSRGIARIDGTPMTAETPFWIASITKLFIASVTLKLHEEGRVCIDRPMDAYLPGNITRGLHRFRGTDYTDQITLRNLLEHSSGLPDYIEIRRKGEKSLFECILEQGDTSWSREDMVDIVRDVDSPFFPPQPATVEKKRIRYSDTNYQLLCGVIEAVTGKHLPQVLDEMLYQPLGLRQTFPVERMPTEPALRPAAIWHAGEALYIPRAMASFGDPFSTVGDLITFMRALLDGTIFDDPATGRLMTAKWNRFDFSISPVGPGWPIEYGMGMMRMLPPRILTPFRPAPEIVGHTGSTGSWLFFCPALDLLLAGNVSQVTAGPVPFQFVPRLLRAVAPYLT